MDDNYILMSSIEEQLSGTSVVKLGVNKRNELARLVYEICVCTARSPEEVLAQAGFSREQEEKSGFFHRVKSQLVKMRYPSIEKDNDVRIMPLKLLKNRAECTTWKGNLEARRIFVEKQASGLDWTKDFLKQFSSAEVKEIESVNEIRSRISQKDPIAQYNARRENILVTSNKASFVKICPCTKGAKRCGYWVLNLGFGCPFDCSYCYLQNYSNIPGIVLTANIDDYYDPIKEFDSSLRGKMIRIGTGEFTDSLALDRYTGYSGKLIRFFRETKNLILELKTKTAEIDNVLKEDPHDNVVIAWSINTPGIAEKYEKGSSPVQERINAAFEAAKKGYMLGFHFDPVIWYHGWEKEYQDIIKSVFSRKKIKDKTQWISLGTLRYTPGLKQTAEQRFSDNRIFHEGEFFLDVDEKFRYQKKLRSDIYGKMTSFIRDCGVSCWIYLCMEPPDMSSGNLETDARWVTGGY